jgi:hypothetical protein
MDIHRYNEPLHQLQHTLLLAALAVGAALVLGVLVDQALAQFSFAPAAQPAQKLVPAMPASPADNFVYFPSQYENQATEIDEPIDQF